MGLLNDIMNVADEVRSWGYGGWSMARPTTYSFSNASISLGKVSVGNFCYSASGYGVTFRLRF